MEYIDNSPDDKLTEKEAIAMAEAEGITFKDSYQVEGETDKYDTKKEAEKAAKGKPVMQIRETIYPQE